MTCAHCGASADDTKRRNDTHPGLKRIGRSEICAQCTRSANGEWAKVQPDPKTAA